MSKLRFILSVPLLTSCSYAAPLLVADSSGLYGEPAWLQASQAGSSIQTVTSGSFAMPEQAFAEGSNEDDHLAPNSIVAMLPTPEPETILLLPFASAVFFVMRKCFFVTMRVERKAR